MVSALELGHVITIRPHVRHDRAGEGEANGGEVVARFELSSPAPSPMKVARRRPHPPC